MRESVPIVRSLVRETDKLRASFRAGRSDIRAFQEAARSDLLSLQRVLKDTSTTFEETAGGLVLPGNLVRQTEEAGRRVGDGLDNLGNRARSTRNEFSALNEVNKRSSLLLIDVGRGVQDLSFGFRAVVNNLDPIILNFSRFQTAVAASNGGVVTFTASLRALRGALTSATGFLLLINTLFLIGELTGAFDELGEDIADFVRDVLQGFTGIDRAAEQFKESIEEAAQEALELDDSLTLTDAIQSLEEVNRQLDEAVSQRRLLQIQRLASSFASLGLNELVSDNFRTPINALNEEIDRLRKLQPEFQDATRDFGVEEFILGLGDPRVVSSLTLELREAVEGSGLELLELRRRQGQKNIALEGEIARERANVAIRGLEDQRSALQQQFDVLGTVEQRLLERLAEANTATGRVAAEQSVRNFREFSALLEERIGTIDAQIDATRSRAEDEIAQLGSDVGRETRRAIEESARATERLRLQISTEGINQRLALIDFESRSQQAALRRQLSDFEQQFGVSVRLRESINEQIVQLDRLRLFQRGEMLRQEAQQEREHEERLLRLQEDFAVRLGGSEELLLENRVQRARVALQLAEGEVERERELAEELREAEISLDDFRARAFEDRIRRQRREAREFRAFQLEVEAIQEEFRALQAPPEGLIFGTDNAQTTRLNILADRMDRLREDLSEAEASAASVEALVSRIESVRREISVTDPDDTNRLNALRSVLTTLEGELEVAEEAASEVRDIRIELLRTQLEIEEEERDSFNRRIERAERFAQRVTRIFIDAARNRREITATDEAFQQNRFDQQEGRLRRQFAERKISEESFQAQLAKITQDRADFQNKVEQDRLSFVARVQQGIADLGREALENFLTELAAAAVRSAAIAFASSKTSQAIVSSTMAGIAAASAPAATLTSIATFGGSAITGQAAVAQALLSITALARASTGGFAGGGYTGGGGKSDPAGIVHKDEFVFPKRVVRGDPGPFYAMLSAMDRGLDPNSIVAMIRDGGFNVTAASVTRSLGFGYQDGGFVEGFNVLTSSPSRSGSNGDALLGELMLLRRDVAMLSAIIEDQSTRPQKVAVGRESRRILQEAERDKRRVTPRG